MSSLSGKKRKNGLTKKELEDRVSQLEEAIITIQRIATHGKLVHELSQTTYYGGIGVLVDEGKVKSREEWESKNPIASQTFYEFLDIFEVRKMDIDSFVDKLDLNINKTFHSQESAELDNDEEMSSAANEVVLNSISNRSLHGWTFKMNTTTHNSFILAPDVPVGQLLFDKAAKQVSWPTGSRPAAWNIFTEELERDIFYIDVYKGWIVSLRLEDELIALGATKIDA